ncbi:MULTISPECIES: GNAT family N-acetyltransferase [unclassified Corynebacterium]|uniref:GNAT family N-acetyltransferase n=1 Tax=unclassified Corynebacterium TaxID=2624378 RepID=UPI0029CA96BA|nr:MULTISPECIES: GNAT family N-acetyltransferase [unclassified Corynebacterium]WPF66709.1 GNAT family N-acetyltransferase [Corynebacterium sp. 22KM0430]WPF69197.1 GNAT family N-acetyltransferase [Corynebacterium sp. 21KM1197]
MTQNLTDKTGTPVDVRVTPKGNAYAIYLDGADRWAGATYFLDRGEERIFFHTTVGEEYAGRGLAGILVENALADTRAHGLTVIPVCPFVRSWTGKKEWDGPLRQPTEEDLAFVAEHS